MSDGSPSDSPSSLDKRGGDDRLKRSLLRSTWLMSFFTVISRVAGLVREMVIAHFFGNGQDRGRVCHRLDAAQSVPASRGGRRDVGGRAAGIRGLRREKAGIQRGVFPRVHDVYEFRYPVDAGIHRVCQPPCRARFRTRFRFGPRKVAMGGGALPLDVSLPDFHQSRRRGASGAQHTQNLRTSRVYAGVAQPVDHYLGFAARSMARSRAGLGLRRGGAGWRIAAIFLSYSLLMAFGHQAASRVRLESSRR